MNHRHRPRRALFTLYLCASFVAAMAAVPLATSSIQVAQSAAQSSAGGSRAPVYVSVFEQADANRDGRLDKVEFARALALIDENRAESRKP